MTLFTRTIVVSGTVIAVSVGGCGLLPTFDGDKVDYKTARRLPQLEIPPDLTRPSSDDSYAVPDINPRGEATYSAYSKERAAAGGVSSSTILPAQANARIERAGAQRWLVVKADPKSVWNIARDFWEESGFIIDSEDPVAGVMETDWIDSRDKVPDDNPVRGLLAKVLARTRVDTSGAPTALGQRVKFRTRLERGSESDTTEVYISNRGLKETPNSNSSGSVLWKPQPANPELEAEMLSRLMARFGIKQEMAKAEINGGPPLVRATLSKSRDGGGTLSVNDQFDRAWRRVGLALDRVGFTVEDRDRSKGIYFVRYADPDAGKSAPPKGFFARLNPFSSKASTPASDQFRIEVKDTQDVSQVHVLSKDGAQEKSDTANRILTLLYEQLK